MSDEQDVTQDSSPEPAQDSAPAPAAVNAAVQDDRPIQNVVAEFNRKHSRLENMVGNIAQQMSQFMANQATPARGSSPSDDELWSMAQQGDRAAFQELNRRQARQEAEAEYNRRQQDALVDGQLASLAQRYPVFNDVNHPLTQATVAAYNLMTARGAQANKSTLREAMLQAIADRPDLASAAAGVSASDPGRVSAARRAQAGQTGATTRDIPSSRAPRAQQVSQDQMKLARQYGVKDPAKAIERFKKRRDEGTSQMGQVGAYLDDGEIN